MQLNDPATSTTVGRRELMLTAAAVLAASSLPVRAQATSNELPHANVSFEDGLAIPIPADPSLGKGKDRALVLGGGGEYFAAWMLGFMHGLHENGVGYEMPDVIIGTSAGSIVGSSIAGGHLQKLTRDFDFFGAFPKLLAALVPTPKPNPSQLRARELCNTATNASVETIQAIGRGAMAARNSSVSHLQDMIIALTGNLNWPSDKFHAATMDCYTGQRLVVSSSSNVPISHAVTASMSLPGIFGPTWVADRICMDGGMGPSSTHSDLVAGAKRVVVVSLTDGLPGSGPRFSSMPNSIQQEMKELQAAGSKALLIAANPGKVNLVSPEEIAPAMKQGYERAAAEAEKVKAFWA
ncbi:MAG: patatin-like phospholipase family protein [Hyphomicrobium sp.]|jgi:NTE family protein